LGVTEFWDFVVRPPFGPSVSSLRDGDTPVLSWFIPPVSQHGGGHINLFRFARGLQDHGFKSRIVITYDGVAAAQQPIDVVRRQVAEWFGEFHGGVYYMDDPQLPASEVAIATGWQTAYGVRAFRGAALKYYFVQDFEPSFYPSGSEAAFAEATYKFNFIGITAGGWLANLLKTNYGMQTHAVGFSYDRDIYKPCPRRNDGTQRLFFYARPETARRGWEIAYLVLKHVHRLLPHVQFIGAGGHIPADAFDFPVFTPGSVPVTELSDLYSQCDLALVLSLTNLSLLPLELMACGVPVVSNSGPNVEWLLKPPVVTLCPPDPESLAKAVVKMLSAPSDELAKNRQACLEFARATDWTVEIDRLASILWPDVSRLSAGRLQVSGANGTSGRSEMPNRTFAIA
jgi:hypothetical protein